MSGDNKSPKACLQFNSDLPLGGFLETMELRVAAWVLITAPLPISRAVDHPAT